MTKELGVQFLVGARDFYFSITCTPVLSPTHPLQWVLGWFPFGVEQQGCEADHSLPSNTKVKNTGDIPSLACICLHGMVFS
jgi:hypothetical protein